MAMNDEGRRRLRQVLVGRLESLAGAGVAVLPKPRAVESPSPIAAAINAAAAPKSIAPAVTEFAMPGITENSATKRATGWTASHASTLFADEERAPKSISTAPTLEVLREEVVGCTRCAELACTRKQTVFGVGNPQARLCFMGEAPGADEDRLGEPFVGRAGQLLDKIIAACKLKREEVYICNVLKCRPPGNRNPLPEEAANCRRFLDRQLELIQPEFICCLGAVAAQNLLGTPLSIGKLRGKVHTYRGAKVVCTYHPAYLLRNPAAKKDAWEDMKFLMREMGVEL
jgi:uracil-DNA glycosylase